MTDRDDTVVIRKLRSFVDHSVSTELNVPEADEFRAGFERVCSDPDQLARIDAVAIDAAAVRDRSMQLSRDEHAASHDLAEAREEKDRALALRNEALALRNEALARRVGARRKTSRRSVAAADGVSTVRTGVWGFLAGLSSFNVLIAILLTTGTLVTIFGSTSAAAIVSIGQFSLTAAVLLGRFLMLFDLSRRMSRQSRRGAERAMKLLLEHSGGVGIGTEKFR